MNIPNAKLLSLASVIVSSALFHSTSTNAFATEVWSVPGALSPKLSNASSPAVSVDNNGSTVFTYFSDTARVGFRSPQSTFTPSSEKLDPEVISSGVVKKIVTNEAGDTAALVDLAGELSLRLKPKGSSTFGGKIALTIPGESAYVQNIPDVAIDNQGRVTAVWQNTKDYVVVRSVNMNSTTADPPINLAEGDSVARVAPAISANPQGDVAVIWALGASQDIRTAYRFAGNSSFSTSRVISTGTAPNRRRSPLIAVSADGYVTFAWITIDMMNQYLVTTQQSDITDPTTLDAKETVLSEKGSQVRHQINYTRPRLIVNTQGQAIYSWIGPVSGKGVDRAQAIIRTNPTTYSPIRLLSTDDADAQSVALTFPTNGKAAAFVSQKNKVSAYFPKDNDFATGLATPTNRSIIGVTGISAASDNEGNAIVAWDGAQDLASNPLIGYATLDVSGPRFADVKIPAEVERGKEITLSVKPEDTWNDTTQVRWEFDDFSAAGEGSSIKHTFGTSRTVAITITATDSVGNSRKIERSIRVVDPPPPPITTTTPPPPPPATTTPEIPPVTPETPGNVPETPRNPTVKTQYCTVSQLTGLTLPQVKSLLESGKCLLGKVKKPATSKKKARKLTRKGYRLVVVAQSAGPKTQLEVNAKINLTLGWRKVSAKK